MARIRSVHPDLHRDKTLAQASASAERTFVRLWCHLDDEGRGEDDPDLLKADLYPRHRDMDHDAIDGDLAELAELGLVIRYEVDGSRYIACKPETWSRYQKPQKRQPSSLPGPEHPDAVDPSRDQDDTATGPLHDQDDTDTRPLSPGGEGRGEGVGEEDGGPPPDGDVPRWPPVNDGTGEQFTDRVVRWARAHGHIRNVETKADVTRWCIDLAEDQLADSNRRAGAVCQLVVEWVEHVCGEPLADAARKHLVRLLNSQGPKITFAAMAEAVERGAGLSPEYADDPQAIVKYARSCLSRWRAEGAGRIA